VWEKIRDLLESSAQRLKTKGETPGMAVQAAKLGAVLASGKSLVAGLEAEKARLAEREAAIAARVRAALAEGQRNVALEHTVELDRVRASLARKGREIEGTRRAIANAEHVLRLFEQQRTAAKEEPKPAPGEPRNAGAILRDTVSAAGRALGRLESVVVEAKVAVVGDAGLLKLERRDYRGAIDDCTEAIRQDPRCVAAYSNRGTARMRLGDLDGARADLDAAVRLAPTLGSVRGSRGQIRWLQGDDEGALADCDEALRLDPSNVQLYSVRACVRNSRLDADGTIADADEVLRRIPEHAMARYHRAAGRTLKGDAEGATADVNEAIRLAPDLASAFTLRSHLRLHAGDNDGALADANEAIRLDPKEGSTAVARSRARRARNDLEGAYDDATEALRLWPGGGEPLEARASVLHALGDLEGARADLDRAIELEKRHRAFFDRARVRAELGDLPGARSDLRLAVAEDKGSILPRLWLGALLGETNPLDGFPLGDDWTHTIARFLLGNLGEDALLAAAASATVEKERNEHLCEAHGYLGMCAERRGDKKLAARHYEACVATGVSHFGEFAWAKARLAARIDLTDEERLALLLEHGVLTKEEHDLAAASLAADSRRARSS
jgi:tetratricopeptide (TPR) repeat protein